jgi:hypothetical protein
MRQETGSDSLHPNGFDDQRRNARPFHSIVCLIHENWLKKPMAASIGFLNFLRDHFVGLQETDPYGSHFAFNFV